MRQALVIVVAMQLATCIPCFLVDHLSTLIRYSAFSALMSTLLTMIMSEMRHFLLVQTKNLRKLDNEYDSKSTGLQPWHTMQNWHSSILAASVQSCDEG